MLKIYDIDTARRTILRRLPLNLSEFPKQVLERTEKLFGTGITPQEAVRKILDSTREEGDSALKRWSTLLDKICPKKFRIEKDQLQEAAESISEPLMQAMLTSAQRIRDFHQMQPLPDWETTTMGGRLGQRVIPVARAGVYVPGGTAPLPSSLLMSVIPAQAAGVKEIIVCTPPVPHPAILAAAFICGLEEVYQVGGAQAIAAMAFGTETVPRVDKIVGAGNLFVTLAKQQVYGLVGLDGLAGPTETVIIADDRANPAWLAADLLAQAEHDPLARAILLTSSCTLAKAVQSEAARQIEDLSRAEIIVESLENGGGIVITPDLETAAALADDFAPEHLCLSVAEPEVLAERIRNAGGLFIGETSFEVLGDYAAGPSHVMPTGGTARFASPLNVMDFVKITSIIALDARTSRKLSAAAAQIAEAETLSAHAASARFREGKLDD